MAVKFALSWFNLQLVQSLLERERERKNKTKQLKTKLTASAVKKNFNAQSAMTVYSWANSVLKQARNTREVQKNAE